jgi:thioesterase domain-containing protein
VFVLAPPRSGTTLLRVLLGGHPQLFAPPELELLTFATLAERKAAFTGRDSFWLEGTLRALMEVRRCDAAEAQRLMADFEERGWTTRQFYGQLQDWLGERWLVDKTPSYALEPDVLRRMEEEFEGARYLHLLRHPAAVVRSFEEARLEQLFFRRPHSFTPRQLAELVWAVSHQNVAEFLQQVPAERQHRVRFEDLVREPEPVLRGVCSFLGLDFHPATLRPYEDRKGRMTDGIHPESRMLGDVKFHEHQGIDAAVADRWKESGAADDLGEVTWQTAESLGYEPPAAAGGVDPRFQSVLVRLHGHGPRPPFFCVHPLGGSVFPFGLLALHVGSEQPFYGLQALGLYNNEAPHARLEDMAAHYAEAMRSAQPEGPYLVGGWSLGGIVALEIAQQLHAQGHEVGLLAILDSPIFSYLFEPLEGRKMRPEEFTEVKGLARRAARRGLSMNHVLQFSQADQEELMLENVRRANLVGPDVTPARFRRWQEIVTSNYQALMGYQVRPYPGTVTLFRATGNDLGRLPDWGPDLRWGSVAGRLEVEVIPGDHKGILREPNVRVLAERLRARLDQAGRVARREPAGAEEVRR